MPPGRETQALALSSDSPIVDVAESTRKRASKRKRKKEAKQRKKQEEETHHLTTKSFFLIQSTWTVGLVILFLCCVGAGFFLYVNLYQLPFNHVEHVGGGGGLGLSEAPPTPPPLNETRGQHFVYEFSELLLWDDHEVHFRFQHPRSGRLAALSSGSGRLSSYNFCCTLVRQSGTGDGAVRRPVRTRMCQNGDGIQCYVSGQRIWGYVTPADGGRGEDQWYVQCKFQWVVN